MKEKTVYFQNEGFKINLPIDNSRSSRFSVRDNDEILFRLLVKHLYENHLIDINKNIIDLGAYIGDNSIPWALRINGIVYAIDPSEPNIKFINDLAEINNIKNIVTINKCISDKEERMYTNDDFDEEEYISTAVFNKKKGKKFTVAETLDNLHKSGSIENIGFIHLDVEGFEQNVLNGSQRIIDNYRPIINWENHWDTDNYEGTIVYFQNLDYTTFIINELIPTNRPDCRNFLSVPIERRISEKIDSINDHFKDIYKENRADNSKPLLINVSKNRIDVLLKSLKLLLRKIL